MINSSKYFGQAKLALYNPTYQTDSIGHKILTLYLLGIQLNELEGYAYLSAREKTMGIRSPIDQNLIFSRERIHGSDQKIARIVVGLLKRAGIGEPRVGR